MHLLEGFIGEVLAFESTKGYLRKQGIVVTKDKNKSATFSTSKLLFELRCLCVFPSEWVSFCKKKLLTGCTYQKMLV